MASTNRIDSIYDVAAISAEQKKVEELVRASIEQIKAARSQSIDFNVNSKGLADYNKKIKELETALSKMSQASIAAAKASTALAKQKEAEAKASERVEKAKQAELKTEQQVIKTLQAEEKATQQSAKAKQVEEAVVKNLTKEKERLVKQTERESKALEDATNDYMQLSKAYNDAALKAKNYALQLGNDHPVTLQAIADANAMGNKLKQLDAAVGQHQRNVGNYTQATFALTQVLREAPAFANSFATGISAIGNNVPMLVDQFKILRAEVGSNFKALKILGGSMLSFTGLLPIGFLLLQSFSKEFINFIGGLTGSKDAAEKSAAALEKYNDAIETGRARVTALAEAIQFLNTVGKINLEIDFGEGFEVKDLQAQSVGIATQAAEIRNQLQKLSVESDKAFQKYMEGAILEKDYQKIVEADTKRRKELQEQETKLGREQIVVYRQIALEKVKIERERKKKIKDMSEQERKDALEFFKFQMQLLIEEQKARVAIGQGGARDTARRKQAALERELIIGVAEFEVKEKNITRSKLKLIETKKNEDIKISNRQRLLDIMGFAQEEREMLLLSAEETGNALNEKQKELDEKAAAQLLNSQIDTVTFPFKARIDALEDAAMQELLVNARLYKTGKIKKEEYEKRKLEIENKQRKDSLTAEIDYQIQLISISKLSEDEKIKAIERLREIRKELAKQEIADAEKLAAKQLEAQQHLRDTLIGLANEVRGLVFDLFTNALERQKNAVQDQIDLLEQQKQKDIEVANQTITNAQDKADAIAVIEARAAAKKQQLELKQRQLDQQKARFEKARAVTEIVQNTSIAVVKALGQFPGPVGIALAAVIGALGAVQIARVLAQPIPRYKDGTENHPGGLAVVGDGGKSETVVLPDGSLYRTPSKDTLVNLPSGSQVIPDYQGRPQTIGMVQPVDNTDKLLQGFNSVVYAIKRIPQPIIRADRAWIQAHKIGSSYRNYLNRSI